MFGSCPDIFVTYDNLTITSTLNSKNHPHDTSVRAHWHLDNTALRLCYLNDILLYHIRFHFKWSFPGEKSETKGLFDVCLGHTGKQLRRIWGILPRPQGEHEAAQLPKLSQGA